MHTDRLRLPANSHAYHRQTRQSTLFKLSAEMRPNAGHQCTVRCGVAGKQQLLNSGHGDRRELRMTQRSVHQSEGGSTCRTHSAVANCTGRALASHIYLAHEPSLHGIRSSQRSGDVVNPGCYTTYVCVGKQSRREMTEWLREG